MTMLLAVPGSDCTSVTPSGGTGFGLTVEYRPIHLIGVEIGGISSSIDAKVGNLFYVAAAGQAFGQSTASDFTIDVEPLFLGVNFHLFGENNKVDLYLGPFYTYLDTMKGDLTFVRPPAMSLTDPLIESPANYALEVEDNRAFRVNVGFDVKLGKRWIVGGTFRYMSTNGMMAIAISTPPEIIPPFPIDMDFFFFSIGGGVRF